MSNENEKLFTEEEIAQMARDIGQPLPGDLKKREDAFGVGMAYRKTPIVDRNWC